MNFANVTDWRIPEGSVHRVTDSLGRVIWEKRPLTPDELKALADTYDYSYPAGSKSIKIKNISGEPIIITLTSRATTKFNQDPTYTYSLTYYDNSNIAHSLTFSIDHLSYDILVGVDEVISANFVDAMLSNNDLLGFTQPTILSSTGYIALIGGELDTVNKRMPFRFDNSSKLVDASKFYWRIDNSVQMTDEFVQGSFMELFSDSSHLVYPANLDWTDTTNNYAHLYHRTYYNCTNLRTVSTIRIPSHIRTFRMCYQTYSNCVRLTNVDNALVFQSAITNGIAYTNNYATKECAHGAHISGYGVATQILDRTCYETFKGCTAITSAKFSLPWAMCYKTPVDGYTQGAYYGLFDGCTSLVEPPKLERYYCAEGDDGNFSYHRGYSINAYHRIFRNCTSLNKLILATSDTTRWKCPDYEYKYQGGGWVASQTKSNLTEWMNPANSGTIYWSGPYQPQTTGTPSDGYLPNWTFSNNDWF